jgi:hypothetical protein
LGQASLTRGNAAVRLGAAVDDYNWEAYRERSRVDLLINRFKQHRAIATA